MAIAIVSIAAANTVRLYEVKMGAKNQEPE